MSHLQTRGPPRCRVVLCETVDHRETGYREFPTTRRCLAGAATTAVSALGVMSPSFQSPVSSPGDMPHDRPRVLLVEDEATISVALGRLLDRWGFDTLAARTAAEARALLGDVTVDIVVIDFRLPDVRGDEFLFWLQREYPDLSKRSMFITGDYGEQALSAIDATGRPNILKPFEVGIFVHELRALIDPLDGPRTNGHATVHTRSDISAA